MAKAKPLPSSAVAPAVSAPQVRISRSNRAKARHDPQAFPEIRSRQLLKDLEDPTLDQEDDLNETF